MSWPGPALPPLRMTISMLGASRSGKSSYILGLYESLARGNYGYTLSTADNAANLRMRDEWRALCNGKSVAPTDAEPREHKFTFTAATTRGHSVIAEIELTDFRGGAMLDEESDSQRLYGLLHRSDSIFVMFDSTSFREPLSAGRRPWVEQETEATRISNLLGEALAGRARSLSPPPSVAVLATKSDTLDQQGDQPGRGFAELQRDVAALVPLAFQLRDKSRLFQVSIGRFPEADGFGPPATIDLRGVAVPLFFAVIRFLQDSQYALRQERIAQDARCADVAGELYKLQRQPAIARWFRGPRIRTIQSDLRLQTDNLAEIDARLRQIEEHLRLLGATLGERAS